MTKRAMLAGVLVLVGMGSALVADRRQAAPNPKASQHGTVTQQVAETTITIDYNRPVARGRELFGALVPYGKVWCPGADYCTTIAVTTDIKLEGQTLPAGTYSLWAQPDAQRWTLIVNRAHPIFHTRYPVDQDLFRVQVTPRSGAHMETLAFYFPMVDGRRAELALHWGTTVVALAIEVP